MYRLGRYFIAISICGKVVDANWLPEHVAQIIVGICYISLSSECTSFCFSLSYLNWLGSLLHWPSTGLPLLKKIPQYASVVAHPLYAPPWATNFVYDIKFPGNGIDICENISAYPQIYNPPVHLRLKHTWWHTYLWLHQKNFPSITNLLTTGYSMYIICHGIIFPIALPLYSVILPSIRSYAITIVSYEWLLLLGVVNLCQRQTNKQRKPVKNLDSRATTQMTVSVR